MKTNYTYIPTEKKWKCRKCGKLIKEYGWSAHNRIHKKNIHEINKHIDTY